MNRWKNPRGPGPIPWMENYLSICIHVNRRANEINGRPRLGETGDKMRDNIKSHQTAAGKCIFDESATMIAGERVFGELTSFRRWLIKSDDFNIFDFRSDSRRNEIHHPQKTKSAQISVEILTKKNFVPENLR